MCIVRLAIRYQLEWKMIKHMNFFKQLIHFNWKIIILQYCDGFCIHQHESAMGAHVSPNPEPPSHLSPHCIPLGCSRALALSVLLRTWNLDWSSVLHMVIYMFQGYSLKSSHPHLLPCNPKVYSLQLKHINFWAESSERYRLSSMAIFILKAFWIHSKKIKIQRIKLIPSNVTALLNKGPQIFKVIETTIFKKNHSTQQCVIHNV